MPAGGLFAGRGEFKGFEEHFGELLGGIQIKGIAHCLVNLRFDLVQARAHLTAEFFEESVVEADAGTFHLHQNGQERHLDLFKHFLTIVGFHFIGKEGHKLKGDFSIGSGVGGGFCHRYQVHRDLAFSTADQLFNMGHADVEISPGHIF